MEMGRAYIMHCGDWHSYVGRLLKQAGPQTYVFESVSKVCETRNGDCWEALAAGDQRLRDACEYRHYTTLLTLPLSIAAIEWEGDTPQEYEAKKSGGATKSKRATAKA